ncbi:pyrroline-5-carboxylate reductase [Pararhizobium polonicum]|uniref:Pyrroline-5-carboxylate reductase n=1 Tax=Pararhizobium polonicum TaxID=1612624 RepID=A0A1C7P265_9HYPH|nr:pyrroline-5-carboxylate reductase [Pararhizobium polonicum]OBZ95076.1 pyrroline-5-carboxylate reductase [Pararhizobium polonicum]
MIEGTLGFIGTGTITEAIITGIFAVPDRAADILVSPRNAEVAAKLAARYPSVRIAGSNQEIVDAADMLFLAVRPQIAEEVIRALRFRPGQRVVSLIAAVHDAKLTEWIDQKVEIVRAVPLPFVADRTGVTMIYPPEPRAASFFAGLGTAVECETQNEYDLLAAASALMGTYFGLLERTTEWLTSQGISEQKSRNYLAPLFASLGRTSVISQDRSPGDLRREFSTKGGLNEQLFREFEQGGGTEALTAALTSVLLRIKT